MSIRYNAENGVISLETRGTLYQMQADDYGMLLHIYYGRKLAGEDAVRLLRYTDRGFSGNPYTRTNGRGYSADTLPQEYGGCNTGDYRVSAVSLVLADGSRGAELLFEDYEILEGKYTIPGMPYVRAGASRPQTLRVRLRDRVSGLAADLYYGVFEEEDVITRTVCLINEGTEPITLEKAASMSIDFPFAPEGGFEVMHFHGRHCMERIPERLPLGRGVVSFGSMRGMSSHHNNPFAILCAPVTTEDAGECYGFMLAYSGNHKEEFEVDQAGSTRVTAGIAQENFSWRLAPGECFFAPEAILSFSAEGFNGLSHCFHRILRRNVIPERFAGLKRPVLVNSWEAMYMDFNADKLLKLAADAKALDMDMLVLDDGWFGKRDRDDSGLGDWYVNEKKLGCTMKQLAEKVNALGMKFGLWVEPEMISEDSDLYRAHPDWAVCDPGRKPVLSRNQLVLDMSREDVQEYLFEALGRILRDAPISYLKWDFNRAVANVYSNALPKDRQGEFSHRFVLGTYALLERLAESFPEVMIEGCAGGGGRFDAGMLYYCPQIWCSDDTDPVERLEIQRGTSYGYPACSMGAHVSASPNHQTGRQTPFGLRGMTAMAGTFGYELDPGKLSDAEKEQVREQIADFRRYDRLLREGRYYRLGNHPELSDHQAWMVAAEDGSEALLTAVITHVRANGPFIRICLKGLDASAVYRVAAYRISGVTFEKTAVGETYGGAALMYAGISLPLLYGDYPSVQIYFKKER